MISLRFPQKLRQLGDVLRNPPRLVFRVSTSAIAHERFDQLMIGLSPQISTVKFKQVERAMFGISD